MANSSMRLDFEIKECEAKKSVFSGLERPYKPLIKKPGLILKANFNIGENKGKTPSSWTSLVTQQCNYPSANAGNMGSIPGLRRSPGERDGNLLQYSCLENHMDRGA